MLRSSVACLVLLSATAAAASLAAAPSPPPRATLQMAVNGVVGVCVRWGADPRHVEEAVVAVTSGNATLDNAIPATVRAMEWAPAANYRGQWVGYWLTVGNRHSIPVSDSYPACSHLPAPPARSAPGSST
jgi:hypothetical protein